MGRPNAIERLREVIARTNGRLSVADARGGVELHMSLSDVKVLVAGGQLCIEAIEAREQQGVSHGE